MIAVMISEIAGWLKQESKTTISVMVIIIGLVGSFSFVRPDFLMESLTGIFLWVAIKAGNENWSEFRIREWLKRTKLSLRNVIIGKELAVLVITLIHFLLVLPVLIITLILWGFTWWQLTSVLLNILIAVLIVAGFGLCGSCLRKDEENIIAGISIGVWIVVTALVPVLRNFNPFYLTWKVLVLGIKPPIILIHLFNLGLVILWIFATEYFFRKEVRYD